MSKELSSFFEKNRLLLAPMAGVTDLAFRSLCIEEGADLTYSEMVSAKGLSYSNDKTTKLLDLAPNETQIAIQIFGHEAKVMAEEAAAIHERLGDSLAFIDINMGCPARKIVKKGDGSALMKDPRRAAEIVSSVSSRISVPVTVKFRRGYEIGSDTAVSFAQRMEEAGASAVAVHGRYAEQLYRGEADWEVVAKVKNALDIPVVGNGDIKSGEDVVKLAQQSSCDAFMIGRAARGCPWIFREAKAALAGLDTKTHLNAAQRLSFARRHTFLLESFKSREVVRMRKHAMWYVAGLPGASIARERFNACSSYQDFEEVFNDLESFAKGEKHV